MKRPSENESISIVDKGDVVTFRWEDGTTAQVPNEVVANSTLLRATLSDTALGCEGKIVLQQGVLQQWIDFVSDEPHLLKMLKAADFLGDDVSVKRLSVHAAVWLFEGDCSLAGKRGEAVARLPSNLIEMVLRDSAACLAEQLRHLPQGLRAAAICVAFPSIVEHGSIEKPEGGQLISVDDMRLLWPHIKDIPQLTALNLRHIPFSQESFEDLMKHLGSMSNLRRLDLDHSLHIVRRGIPSLMPVLGKLSGLQELDLSYAHIGSRGVDNAAVDALATGLSMLTDLEHFALRGLRMIPDEVEQLTLSISCHLTSLKSLDLYSIGLHECNIPEFVAHLIKMSTLRELWMGHNNLGPESIPVLGAGLAKLPSLEVLSLPRISRKRYSLRMECRISSGMPQLAAYLVKCTGLQRLDLSLNEVDDDDFVPLMRHLSSLTSLQRLLLAGSNISDDGLLRSLQCFKALSNLQVLSLFSFDGEEPTQKSLLPLVQKLPMLKVVGVNPEWIFDETDSAEVFRGPYFGWDLPGEHRSVDDIKRSELCANMHPSVSEFSSEDYSSE